MFDLNTVIILANRLYKKTGQVHQVIQCINGSYDIIVKGIKTNKKIVYTTNDS